MYCEHRDWSFKRRNKMVEVNYNEIKQLTTPRGAL